MERVQREKIIKIGPVKIAQNVQKKSSKDHKRRGE
jgi:hypothetical protein